MPQNGRTPGAHVVDQFASVCREKAATFGAFHKKGFAANGPEGADWRIDTAGNSATGGGKQFRRRGRVAIR